MATWRADCWLGQSDGWQELEVKSNTPHGAKGQFESIYGAEQVSNLREVSSSGSSSGGDISGWFMIALLVLSLWLLLEFWWIFVPLGAICIALIIYGSTDD